VKVLVTGGAGFIGRHLCAGLRDRGHQVACLDVVASDVPGIATRVGDVRDAGLLDEMLSGADVVHHLASVHLDVHASERDFAAVNVDAATALVAAAARQGVRRVVHASSVGIYGHVADPPADEAAPRNPGNAYERSKAAGEDAALAAAREHLQEVVVLRPAWVYGPGCPRTAKLLRAIASGRFLYVGAGTNLRHPVYVDDVVAAFALAAEAPETVAGNAYIVAGPHALPLRAMVEAFARALGVPAPSRALPRPLAVGLGLGLEVAYGAVGKQPPFSRRSIVFFENDNAFETAAATRDLGFTARTDLDAGLAATLARRREEAA
jgi:nucleoside-diphosphate-sugar epimerase